MKPTGPLLALLAALLLLAPSAAQAHLRLTGSAPAAEEVLSVAPTSVRLTFTERVALPLAALSLTGPQGEVRLGALAAPADSPSSMVAPVLGDLVPGEYTVTWQAASSDGHPMRGEYRFTILPGAAGLREDVEPPPPPTPLAAAPAPPRAERFGVESPGYVAVRWGTFVALLAVIGTASFRLLVLGRLRGQEMLVAGAAPRAARLGLWAAALLLIAGFLRLAAESLATLGEVPAFPRLFAILTGTFWGWGWLVQVAATLLALAGFLLARRGADLGWMIAALGAVVLAFAPALSGHAAASDRLQGAAIVADGLHVFGAGGWLGTLLVLLVVGLPVALAVDRRGKRRTLPEMVAAFSSIALTFAAVVTLSGLFTAWLHLGTLPALWESRYGRTLLVKLALVALVAAAGLFNWRRARPGLESPEGAAFLRRSAVAELAAALLVLAVTAALVATRPPTP